ncbi:MAG TPA: ergothioneine biosynthesis protein EgtB [Solirubrobacteraceae bacterium]|nr:ergothioneine biosynthesis protein EgtB [Solirubrobacteraceae bacterium]
MSVAVKLGDPVPPQPLAALAEARERTLGLVAGISDEDLERVHSTLMSPLVWDLGHIAAFEDLWIAHRHGGRPLLRGDLADTYDAFETPRAHRGELDHLPPAQARDYLAEVRARTLEVLAERGPGDGTIIELIVRHEHQHGETMLQTMQLARLRGFEPTPPPAPNPESVDAAAPGGDGLATPSGLELVEVPAGPCLIGAPTEGFAYDNERPRHRVELPAFRIGRFPVTNGDWLDWIEDGGYGRREWWSSEGWAWRQAEGAERPAGWTAELTHEWRLGRCEPLDPRRPVIHVSFHEAEAFATARGLRLPSELEWEKAASCDPDGDRTLASPWGEDAGEPGTHANLDQLAGGTTPVGSLPHSASPIGCEQMLGDVWEWTASAFDGYPGFRAFPYREYSEVFFGNEYRVLRGGSWATRARVATVTFRNWDFPQRRQIFAGLRLAADA